MASTATGYRVIHFLIITFLLVLATGETTAADDPDPVPAQWPEQFHALLFMNYSGSLEMIDLWYDWVNGRNFNIIQEQLGNLKYDLEWNNGTSFFYRLDESRMCRTSQLEWFRCESVIKQESIEKATDCSKLKQQRASVDQVRVGILRPNWLDGATYLGQRYMDGFLCNVWEKVDFVWYYEDVVTKRPVHWVFYTGREAHVMTYEVGAVLEDEKWQAPVYCFDKENKSFSSQGGLREFKGFGTYVVIAK